MVERSTGVPRASSVVDDASGGGEAVLRTFGDVMAHVRTVYADRGTVTELPGGAILDTGRADVWLDDGSGSEEIPRDAAVVCVGAEPSPRRLASFRGRSVSFLPLPISAPTAAAVVATALGAADRGHAMETTSRLLDIGLALNAERDPGRLLDLILTHARRITGADAGSIYLVEEDGRRLRFKVAQNDSVEADFSEFSVPVTEESIVGACVVCGQTVNIADLYEDPTALGRTFRHDRRFDERFGYQTRSVLTTPLRPPGGDVVGVLQLINAKEGDGPLRGEDFRRRVRPFSLADERLCEALAAQAAVALENARLYEEIRGLFEGFVRASVHAIEQRDPTTSGHSQRVADLTVELAKVVDRVDDGPLAPLRFDREDLRQIEYAGLLHDFGKVGVREEVLVKAKKLHPAQLDRILSRLDHMRTAVHLDVARKLIERLRAGWTGGEEDLERELSQRLADVDAWAKAVLEANEPTLLAAEPEARIQELARLEFRDGDGRRIRILEDEEVRALLVRKGSLTDEERAQIQSHVTHTYNFLVRIPWGKQLSRLPDIAAKHHEYLDGTGYPNRLGAEDIPVETRMMTISDIFDALTAADRPYKKAVPVRHALDILDAERRNGRIDAALLEVFVEARVFRAIGLDLEGPR
ncbi:MAG: GAF domain-containing protein [Deltaproteobacteria bacterium]|nr:MAG: GAF domain-containing protein [Deltaproteobacteria bacterium]